MLIPCPNCKAQISGKLPKPGRYTPKCPKCGSQFLLIVPDSPDATVQVKAVPVDPAVKAAAAASKPIPPVSKSSRLSQVTLSPAARVPVPDTAPAAAEMTGDFTNPVPPSEATGDFSRPAVDAGGQTEVTGDFAAPGPQGSDTHVEATGDFSPRGQSEATEAPGDFRSPASVDETAAHTSSGEPDDGDGGSGGSNATTDFEAERKPKKKKKPAAEVPMPEQLGGYGVRKMLGKGGMGAVYLAQQVSLDRPVALKVMNPEWAEDPIFLARFVREAYAAAQLNHHNVVQIYDIGEDKGINFFSMEFVEGKSLGDVLRKNGQLDPAVAVGYILQGARGLKFAHDRGMVHRDVKPDNMMLNTEGLVKVA
ncbi:MAG: protein kinase domain-containing protein, partial [Fimbriiglobus sp.]